MLRRGLQLLTAASSRAGGAAVVAAAASASATPLQQQARGLAALAAQQQWGPSRLLADDDRWQQRQQQQPHHQLWQHQQLHTSAARALQHHVQLDRLRPARGSSKLAKRWGRGDGGDRGTYCGRGVKGQKARKGSKPHLLFDGGQKQLKKFPKVGLTPSSPVLYRQVRLSKVLRWVALGLLDASQVITMKDLRDSGCASKIIRWGVELVATGKERVRLPLHLQVSSVSPEALRAVEGAGGSVTRVYYTQLGLRALLKPENFEKQGRLLPRPVRAWPPREDGKFDAIGLIPPHTDLPTAGGVAAFLTAPSGVGGGLGLGRRVTQAAGCSEW